MASTTDPEWVIGCVYAALAEVAPSVPPGLVLSVRMADHDQIMCSIYLSLENPMYAYSLMRIWRKRGDGKGVLVRFDEIFNMKNREVANAGELSQLLLEALRSNGFRYLAGKIAMRQEEILGEYV